MKLNNHFTACINLISPHACFVLQVLAFFGWIVAFATGLAVIYGLFGSIHDAKLLTVNLAAFYNAVSRPLWAFCLTWLVIACSSGYGGKIGMDWCRNRIFTERFACRANKRFLELESIHPVESVDVLCLSRAPTCHILGIWCFGNAFTFQLTYNIRPIYR